MIDLDIYRYDPIDDPSRFMILFLSISDDPIDDLLIIRYQNLRV